VVVMLRCSPGQVLVKLVRRRLLEVAAELEVELPPARRKQDVVNSLAGLPPEDFEDLLKLLTPDELRVLCRAAKLDDSGREERLRDRLLGREERIKALPRPRPRESSEPSAPPMQRDLERDGEHKQKALQKHLWKAANILRGTIDSSDYRPFILGLLFYKRLSDVWEEEFEAQLLETGDERLAADPREHRFQIPREVLWNEVCGLRQEGIGARLNDAFRAIEEANPKLRGLFQEVDFAHQERFPDANLERLVRHFEKVRLRNIDVPTDMLGNAYLYLIAKFADDAGKKGGEFYTPKAVVQLLVECLDPHRDMTVYDPACGSGGMLLEAMAYAKRAHQEDPPRLRLYGQERNLTTCRICQLNFFLHEIDDASVKKGDTLRSPQHLRPDGNLRQFDRVLANPPFSLKAWGYELWRDGDPFGRDVYGCPPPTFGDFAFVQHMLASLNPTGILGVVLPNGVLFRGGTEGRIRRGLLEEDLIEAVISLASNLFYGTAIPACILILNRSKPAMRRGKVLFVRGAGEVQPGKNQNTLSQANVERLRDAFKRFGDEEHFSRVVHLEEIAKKEYSLSLPRYIPDAVEESREDVSLILKEMQDLEEEAKALSHRLTGGLREIGYEPKRA
jgi:type I restriction enzyme M protein